MYQQRDADFFYCFHFNLSFKEILNYKILKIALTIYCAKISCKNKL